jgi:hypothetical protein
MANDSLILVFKREMTDTNVPPRGPGSAVYVQIWRVQTFRSNSQSTYTRRSRARGETSAIVHRNLDRAATKPLVDLRSIFNETVCGTKLIEPPCTAQSAPTSHSYKLESFCASPHPQPLAQSSTRNLHPTQGQLPRQTHRRQPGNQAITKHVVQLRHVSMCVSVHEY